MARRSEPELKVASARPDSRALKTRIPGKQSVTIKMLMPTWYLKLMDEETALLGYSQRRRLLETLVLWKAGLQTKSRRPDAPAVKRPKPGALEDQEYYQWHCPIAVKGHLDGMLKRNPGLTPRGWIILAIHEWIDLPFVL